MRVGNKLLLITRNLSDHPGNSQERALFADLELADDLWFSDAPAIC
jgi:hypothetical protein